jgi:hypothetical protein
MVRLHNPRGRAVDERRSESGTLRSNSDSETIRANGRRVMVTASGSARVGE